MYIDDDARRYLLRLQGEHPDKVILVVHQGYG